MSDWRFLARLLRGSSGRTLAAHLLLAATWGAGIALLALSGWLITASALAGAGLLLGLDVFTPSAGVRAAAILRTLARYGERVVGHDAVLRVLADLRARSFAALSRLPAAAQRELRSGDLQQRLTADVDTLDAVPLRITGPVTAAVLTVTGAALVAALVAPWPAALLLSATGILTLAASALAARRGQARSRETVAGRSRQRVALLDFFGGLPELVAFRRASAQRGLLDAIEQAQADRLWVRERFGVFAEQAVQLLVALGSLVMLGLALHWHAAGAVTGPVAALLTLMSLGLGEALAALPPAAWRVGESLQAAARLRALGVAPPAPSGPQGPAPGRPVAPPKAARPAPGPMYAVHRLDVGFHPGRPLLGPLSFALEPGAPLVVHGPSGLGKSTLLATLAGELSPLAGTVTLAGRAAEAWPDAWRYRLIGYLPQETLLLDDTVAANLRLGRPDLTDAALWDALEGVGLAAALREDGAGLAYPVGEGGRRLSGGQARRLALARLLLHGPEVALLDEPFAGLDAATERRVLAAIIPWLEQRRAVIVTHAPQRLPGAWPRLRLGPRAGGLPGTSSAPPAPARSAAAP